MGPCRTGNPPRCLSGTDPSAPGRALRCRAGTGKTIGSPAHNVADPDRTWRGKGFRAVFPTIPQHRYVARNDVPDWSCRRLSVLPPQRNDTCQEASASFSSRMAVSVGASPARDIAINREQGSLLQNAHCFTLKFLQRLVMTIAQRLLRLAYAGYAGIRRNFQ